MRLTGEDVLAIKALIEADRFGEGFDAVVRLAAKAATPGLLAHRIRRSANTSPKRERGRLPEPRLRVGLICYSPNSFSCLRSTGAGAPVIKSRAFWFLGNAMTSRMLVVPASTIVRRFTPKAMPPCGAGPDRSRRTGRRKRSGPFSRRMPHR